MTEHAVPGYSGNALVALRARARATPWDRLVFVQAAGLAAALAVWMWLPAHSELALPFLSLSAFGIWGVVDRTLGAKRRTLAAPARYCLRALRWVVALLGVAAGAATLYLTAGAMIGTIIS
ncbi:MAG TPA: hypothetical protein VHM24_08385 [Gemmatimonadaceae bacterium]|nr:hypothetical protein [Gemmatimonadaceae bacterium]